MHFMLFGRLIQIYKLNGQWKFRLYFTKYHTVYQLWLGLIGISIEVKHDHT